MAPRHRCDTIDLIEDVASWPEVVCLDPTLCFERAVEVTHRVDGSVRSLREGLAQNTHASGMHRVLACWTDLAVRWALIVDNNQSGRRTDDVSAGSNMDVFVFQLLSVKRYISILKTAL